MVKKLHRLRKGTKVFYNLRTIKSDPKYVPILAVVVDSFISQNGNRYYSIQLDDKSCLGSIKREDLIDAEQAVRIALAG
jgi:hypothetical protein